MEAQKVEYQEFLNRKAQLGEDHGFAPRFMPDSLFGFQNSLVEWSVRKGRAALFADTGLGKTPMQLTWAQNVVEHFMRKLPYRLLATATASPNDFIELGTSSEALGYLGYMDMLNRFFVNDNKNSSSRNHYGKAVQWRFKGHAEETFWRWVYAARNFASITR